MDFSVFAGIIKFRSAWFLLYQRHFDIFEGSTLKELMCIRYNLNENPKYIDYETDVKILQGKPLDEIFLTDNEEKLKVFALSNGDESKKLVLGNLRKADVDYAVVKLVNWEQVPFDDGNEIKYFELEIGSKLSSSVNIPKVEKDSVVQYVAFPYPFKVSEHRYYGSRAMGSFRVTVLGE